MSESGGPHFLLHVRCPSCGSELQFHQTVAGQRRQCPKCKAAFRVAAGKLTGAARNPAGRIESGPADSQSETRE